MSKSDDYDLFPELLTHSIRNIEKRDRSFEEITQDYEKTMERIRDLMNLIKERNIVAMPYSEKVLK